MLCDAYCVMRALAFHISELHQIGSRGIIWPLS